MRDTDREVRRMRPGRVEDHPDFVRLFAELGVEEAPPAWDVWAAELVKRSFFLDGAEGAAAYALIDVLGRTGYVVNLVVAPEQRRHGLGGWLMRELAGVFRERGCREWMLYVKPDNVAALALYTGLGMKAGRLETTWRLSRAHLDALPWVPENIEAVPLEARDFAPLTETFSLVPGKLARFAAQGGLHQLWRLLDLDAPEAPCEGWMDVRPQAGVLAPFFAATPAHARALLEEAFLQLAGPAELRVVTEDAGLGALLQAAGARPGLRTLEMKGELPPPSP